MLSCLGHFSAKKSRTKKIQRSDFQPHATFFVLVGPVKLESELDWLWATRASHRWTGWALPEPHCLRCELLSCEKPYVSDLRQVIL